MRWIIIAFRSRAQTIKFYDFLQRNGVYSNIVNTPKEAGVGCGLSVKIREESFVPVKRAVFASGFKSFAGFFAVSDAGGRRIVKSI